jgi:hypothetical protein
MRRFLLAAVTLSALLLSSCTYVKSTLSKAKTGDDYMVTPTDERAQVVAGLSSPMAAKNAYTLPLAAPPPSPTGGSTADRKIVRTAALEIIVEDPQQIVQRITALAQQYGGYVESATLSGSRPKAQSAEMVLRIPEAKLDDAREQIKKIAAHVEKDNVQAKDVTREYVDMDARLRNLKAQEQQYLVLMKRATAVKDMTEIQEQLGEVRGEIESLQGELEYLTKQIQLSTLSLSIQPEAEAQVGGVYWHPWLTIKKSFRDMVEGLVDFADSVIELVFYLPVIALWLLVIVFVTKILFRTAKWLWRRFLPEGVAALWRRKPQQS